MTDPNVTVVVVPRERFSPTERNLETLFETTTVPFELVYVDGGSPRRVSSYLRRRAEERGFRLVRHDRYLAPNEARNIGLAEANTEYVVFVDNDVAVTPGWLEKLLECAEQTGATVVGPLTLYGALEKEEIHVAGGDVQIVEEHANGEVCRSVKEKLFLVGRKASDVRAELRRMPCPLAEFHTMLVRTAIFEKTGPFDESMLSTREHLDFCLAVANAGGEVWFEPESVVSYVPGPPFKPSDLPFFMLRWSDAWERASLKRFQEKWELTEDDFFKRRYERLGWRRQHSLVHPIAKRMTKVTRGRGTRKVEKVLGRGDRVINRVITDRHARTSAKASP